jgi:hypothetical protein
MKRTTFLIMTAVIEGATGILFIFLPAVLLTVLLGESSVTPETTFYFRFFGAVLVVFCAACWLVRNHHGPAQLGWLIGALVYDVAAAALLAYLGVARGMTGIALWPAVLAHTVLAVWAVISLRDNPRDRTVGIGADLKAATGENGANGT